MNATEELVQLVQDLHGLTIKLAEERDAAVAKSEAADKKASDLQIELEKVAGQVKAAAGRQVDPAKIASAVDKLVERGITSPENREKFAAALANPEACLDTVFELAGMIRPMQGTGVPVNLPTTLPPTTKSASAEEAEEAAERAELREMVNGGEL